ncbi:unnamed protein product, partial [Prorocentrum cordatum]
LKPRHPRGRGHPACFFSRASSRRHCFERHGLQLQLGGPHDRSRHRGGALQRWAARRQDNGRACDEGGAAAVARAAHEAPGRCSGRGPGEHGQGRGHLQYPEEWAARRVEQVPGDPAFAPGVHHHGGERHHGLLGHHRGVAQARRPRHEDHRRAAGFRWAQLVPGDHRHGEEPRGQGGQDRRPNQSEIDRTLTLPTSLASCHFRFSRWRCAALFSGLHPLSLVLGRFL